MDDDLLRELREIRAAIARLEGVRQAPRQDFRDEQQRLRTRIGRQDDDTWGIRVWDAAGALVEDVTG